MLSAVMFNVTLLSSNFYFCAGYSYAVAFFIVMLTVVKLNVALLSMPEPHLRPV
jgi:hypothetical protein